MSATIALLASAPTATVIAAWAVTTRRLTRLQAQLRTDTLTALANRHGLARAVDQARRRSAALGLLLIDADGFKRVNDTHGHDEGNTVLCHVARQLTAATRLSELAVRLHGDEFALLLTNLPAGTRGHRIAAQRVAAVRRSIAEPFVTDRTCHCVRVSIGAAVLPTDHAQLSALLALADAAMYRDKTRRRAHRTAQRPGGD